MFDRKFYEEFEGFLYHSNDISVLKDVRGAYKTQSLFLEFSNRNEYEPLYTLKEDDTKGYPSAYKIYMSSVNETEAALKLVGSMTHWRKLCKLKWFMEGIYAMGFIGLEMWREDMRLRDEMIAKKLLMIKAEEGNVSAIRALRDNKPSIKKIKKLEGSEVDQNIVDFQKEIDRLS